MTPRYTRIKVLLFFALSLAWPVLADEWLDDFASAISHKAADKNLPGYAFAFVDKDKPARIYLYGKESAQGEAVTTASVFRLASVSKTFTAMLMAKYVAQQRLTWQQPVSQILPRYSLSKKDSEQLLLQHIIGQSSGYTPNAYDNLIEANYPVDKVLSMLADLNPLCEPGKCYTYQNALFAVVEEYFQQHHSSYAQALNQTLLKPLNMPYASVGKTRLQEA
ncbi:MAG: beta-lactamase family protein, partial [Paraglaciecola sp.]|nr:beta-lactamase family protein [Paraglaciecola sp.]